MVGGAADGGGGVPQRTATVQIPLVLLQLFQVVQEGDAVAHDVESHVLQVAVGESESTCQLREREQSITYVRVATVEPL